MAVAQEKDKRPNIILIMADDLGYGDLGVYGQQKIETRHIDSLAAKGMKFDNFYAGTSVCAPSRSSLMTGQHTGHTYIRGNKEIEPEGQQPLADCTNFCDASTTGRIYNRCVWKMGTWHGPYNRCS